MLTRLLASLRSRVGFFSTERSSFVARPLADSSLLSLTETKVWNVNLGQRYTDRVLPLPGDQLATGNIMLEIPSNFPTHNVAETPGIGIDSADQSNSLSFNRVRSQRCPSIAVRWRTCGHSSTAVFDISSRKNARNVVEYIGRTVFVVAILLDQTVFDNVNLLLRVLVDNI